MQSLKQVSLNTETSHPVKVLWAPRSVGRYAVINALSAALLLSAACHAATFTIDSPECVQDTALWNREFSGWNFGGSPLLEVGSVPGLYEEHRSVSLIRFDLSGLACETIEGATLRLYKPNSFVQRSPVEVQVYEVSAANANWKEGRMEAAPDSNGASWDFLRHDTPWTGGSGLAVEKEAYKSPALAVRTAPHDRGVWLEFQLPAELVQRWLEHPGLNSGLLIKTGDEAEWGEHAHFYASEHHSGNGPQLVLRGTPGSPRAGRTPAAGNLRHMFPREDDPQFLRWLKEADSRYTQWVREYKMTPAQALYIYYYDVIVRGEMLMPRVRIPMFQTLLETEQRIAAGDEAGVREKLNDIRELMLIWEYIRQTQWYDSGPLAEALSPLQLAWLYAKPKSGIFSGIDESGQSWRLLTPAQLDRTVRSRLDTVKRDIRLSDRQYETIAAEYEDYVRKEFHYRAELRNDLDQLYRRIEQEQNDAETLEWVKKLHMDHDLFLYYQSLFNTPRWTLLMEQADAIPLAEMFIRIRDNQHSPGRTRRQIDNAAQFNSTSHSSRAVGDVAIILGVNASSAERIAAEELQRFLSRMYPDTVFQIMSEFPAHGAAMLVGTFDAMPLLQVYVDPKTAAHSEMFRIRSLPNTRNPHLVIAGRDGRAVLTGVYKLLEKLGGGFYLSGDVVPQKGCFVFEPMDWTDRPLVERRFIFNWHNFLSGCTAWNLDDWQKWIVQSQKMGFNGIMVHAYGNNPMIGYDAGGVHRSVGYLASTQVGRDWATNHVNDVRRMWGGHVFESPVFGSVASVEGSDRERTRASQSLIRQAFDYAARREMDIYFAIDIDTESANPQELITLLPESARFEIEGHWLAIPDTPEGYAYYKTQVDQLLRAYPDIDVLALWCRPGRRNGPWTRLTPHNLPSVWQAEYLQKRDANPALAEHEWSPRVFGLAKVVEAYQRAVNEAGRDDVKITFGTWLRRDVLPRRPGHCLSFPLMDAFLPKGVPLMPLDWDIIRDDSFFETPDKQADFIETAIASKRPIWPIAWAHHDDGQYFGPPYKPFTDFYDRLTRMGAAEGFGVIHWMTKPLDIYFKSMANQVWADTKNQPLQQTIRRAAEDMAGKDAAEAFAEYLTDWLETMPRVARETSSRFMHTAREDDALEQLDSVEEGYNRRIRRLNAMDESALTPQGRHWRAYFQGLERFIRDLVAGEHRFRQAIEYRNAGDVDAARNVLAEASTEEIISRFSEFSQNGGMTRGEMGLLVSMNTRWLSHYEMLRQMLGVSPIRYNFGPTSHEPLAQAPGLYTFHFDRQKQLWEVKGKAETGYETYRLEKNTDSSGSDAAEIVQTGIVSDDTMRVSVEPIMADEKYAGPRTLAAGRYRLMLLTPVRGEQKETDKTLTLTILTDGGAKRQTQIEAAPSVKHCNRFEQEFTLTDPGMVTIEITSVSGDKLYVGGLVLYPLAIEL